MCTRMTPHLLESHTQLLFSLTKMVFSCTLCSYSSARKLYLIQHYFSAHSVEPCFQYTCSIRGCLHTFKAGSTFSSFKSHASRTHRDWQSALEPVLTESSTTGTLHDVEGPTNESTMNAEGPLDLSSPGPLLDPSSQELTFTQASNVKVPQSQKNRRPSILQ